MGDDAREFLILIALGLILAFITALVPDVLIAFWTPSTAAAWPHPVVSDPNRAAQKPSARGAAPPPASVTDPAPKSNCLVCDYDSVLDAAADALIRRAVTW